MESTFSKIFELKKCSAKALQETIFDFIKLELWTRKLTTHDILGEQLSLWCIKQDGNIEFNEDKDYAVMELPIKMRTDKWESLITVNSCLPCDDDGRLYFDGSWLTKFQMHCFRGHPKDLGTTFMIVKLTKDMEGGDFD